MDPRETAPRIVVGVEGSGGAKAALRWAIQEAGYRDAVVDVVTAYSGTYVPASPEFNYVPLDPVDLEGEVEKMQGAVVDEVLADARRHRCATQPVCAPRAPFGCLDPRPPRARRCLWLGHAAEAVFAASCSGLSPNRWHITAIARSLSCGLISCREAKSAWAHPAR